MLHSICPQIWNSAVATGLEKVSFHFNPNEGQCQRMFKLSHDCSHFIHSKVVIKILQAGLQQCNNHDLPDIQDGFRKNRVSRDQIANIYWVIKKAREFQKQSTSALLIMPKPLTVSITINCKILKEMGIPDYLICLLRNLYACQEATVRTGHETTDWF